MIFPLLVEHSNNPVHFLLCLSSKSLVPQLLHLTVFPGNMIFLRRFLDFLDFFCWFHGHRCTLFIIRWIWNFNEAKIKYWLTSLLAFSSNKHSVIPEWWHWSPRSLVLTDPSGLFNWYISSQQTIQWALNHSNITNQLWTGNILIPQFVDIFNFFYISQ